MLPTPLPPQRRNYFYAAAECFTVFSINASSDSIAVSSVDVAKIISAVAVKNSSVNAVNAASAFNACTFDDGAKILKPPKHAQPPNALPSPLPTPPQL
jgi:hypothetical protein